MRVKTRMLARPWPWDGIYVLDKIDRLILENTEKMPGARLNAVLDAILKGKDVIITKRALRERIDRLADKGCLRLDRQTQRGAVFCYPGGKRP